MSDHDMTERKQGPARRKKRLSAALRENLKRRKAQARARAASSKRPENTPAPTGNADEDGPGRLSPQSAPSLAPLRGFE